MDKSMTSQHPEFPEEELPPSIEDEAAAWFLRRRRGRLSTEEMQALQNWLLANPAHAAAWRDTEKTWNCLDEQAVTPELIVARRQALTAMRQAQLRRWSAPSSLVKRMRTAMQSSGTRNWSAAAAAVVIAAVGVSFYWTAKNGDRYQTGIGERRTVLLSDNSRITLDAMTQVRVRYGGSARDIELIEGQAQFEVARQPRRPFRVRAGYRVVEALGTVFTVEYIDRHMKVALLEGRVKVDRAPEFLAQVTEKSGRNPAPGTAAVAPISAEVELKPGEALHFDRDDRQSLDKHADLAAETAWREGKVIFRQEPLRDAVKRLNRYSHVQLKVIDPTIESLPVSGIFGDTDAEAFAEAVAEYFPVEFQRVGSGAIELRRR